MISDWQKKFNESTIPFFENSKQNFGTFNLNFKH